ncbi:MAG: hypothetical protein O3C10_06155 [Chloroflexi bacterium]|nr:hypothetical protein [Chloroflexota bacterium]
MTSERVQRRVDRLLDQTEEAVEATEWARVRELAEAVLAADPENADATTFLAMAERASGISATPGTPTTMRRPATLTTG